MINPEKVTSYITSLNIVLLTSYDLANGLKSKYKILTLTHTCLREDRTRVKNKLELY